MAENKCIRLIYLYTGRLGRSVDGNDINFTNEFEVFYTRKTKHLSIKKNPAPPVSIKYADNIIDINMIVGNNGSGKSTIINILGLGERNRREEFPLTFGDYMSTDEDNLRYWFALYHIKDDIFAIEGYWNKMLDFMSKESYGHLQNVYSVCFKYDFTSEDSQFIECLQDYFNNEEEQKPIINNLFYYLYSNNSGIAWHRGVRQLKIDDINGKLFERKLADRTGYNAIIKFLDAAYNDDEFAEKMKTKPGGRIVIGIRRADKSELSVTDYGDEDETNAYYDQADNVAAKMLYGGGVKLASEADVLASQMLKTNNITKISVKEVFVISYLEEIALYSLMQIHRKNLEYALDNDTYNDPKKREQHLLDIVKNECGEDDVDYLLTKKISEDIKEIPDRYFTKNIKVAIPYTDISKSSVDSLMLQLDNNQIDNHEINHRYYLDVRFEGISTGEAHYIDLYAALWNGVMKLEHKDGATCVLLLDEPDYGFHPEWSRLFIRNLCDFLQSEMMKKYNYQVIISTHSPIMISDVDSKNIICLRKKQDKTCVQKDMGYGLLSNINDILADEFFVSSLFGEFGMNYANKILVDMNVLEDNIEKHSISGEEIEEKIKDLKERISVLGRGVIKTSIQRRLDRLRDWNIW